MYAVKCDECKTTIRETDNVRESAAGGRCDDCQAAVEAARELIDLRATMAMRREDLRIARKHEQEAAARVGTSENVNAWKRAVRWTSKCAEAARLAQVAYQAAYSSADDATMRAFGSRS